MNEIWEQTSKKVFDRIIKKNNAKVSNSIPGRYDWYYNKNKAVARIDRNLSVYEININLKLQKSNPISFRKG